MGLTDNLSSEEKPENIVSKAIAKSGQNCE